MRQRLLERKGDGLGHWHGHWHGHLLLPTELWRWAAPQGTPFLHLFHHGAGTRSRKYVMYCTPYIFCKLVCAQRGLFMQHVSSSVASICILRIFDFPLLRFQSSFISFIGPDLTEITFCLTPRLLLLLLLPAARHCLLVGEYEVPSKEERVGVPRA